MIIDHNQAFAREFSIDSFMKYHVFIGQRINLFGDSLYRRKYEEAFRTALNQWQNICDNIPVEWHYLDAEMTVPANIRLDAIFNTLNRFNTEDLWDYT